MQYALMIQTIVVVVDGVIDITVIMQGKVETRNAGKLVKYAIIGLSGDNLVNGTFVLGSLQDVRWEETEDQMQEGNRRGSKDMRTFVL